MLCLKQIDTEIRRLEGELEDLLENCKDQYASPKICLSLCRAYFADFPDMFTEAGPGKFNIKLMNIHVPVLPPWSPRNFKCVVVTAIDLPTKMLVGSDAITAHSWQGGVDAGPYGKTFQTGEQLIAILKELYPLDQVRKYYPTLGTDTSIRDYYSKVEEKKRAVKALHFTYTIGKRVGSETELSSFMTWFNLEKYEFINSVGSGTELAFGDDHTLSFEGALIGVTYSPGDNQVGFVTVCRGGTCKKSEKYSSMGELYSSLVGLINMVRYGHL